jgi:hypothetical protein
MRWPSRSASSSSSSCAGAPGVPNQVSINRPGSAPPLARTPASSLGDIHTVLELQEFSAMGSEKTCIIFTGHLACFLSAQLGPLTFFRQTRGLGPLTIIRTKLLTKPDRQPHESIDLSICSSSLRARPTKRDDARRRALSRTDCGVPRL